MAKRRCFSVEVVETDKFIDMSAQAQNLYFHLSMYADDEGFVSSAKKIARSVLCTEEHISELINCGFIIPFPSGVVVITDWLRNNTLQNDRRKDTEYIDERSTIGTDGMKRYYLMDTSCIQNGNELYTQYNSTEYKPNLTKYNNNPTEQKSNLNGIRELAPWETDEKDPPF